MLKRRQVFICKLHLIVYVFTEALFLVLKILGARDDLVDVHVRGRIIGLGLDFGVVTQRLRGLPENDLVSLGSTVHCARVPAQSYFAGDAFVDVAARVVHTCILLGHALSSRVQVEMPISQRSLGTI